MENMLEDHPNQRRQSSNLIRDIEKSQGAFPFSETQKKKKIVLDEFTIKFSPNTPE